MHRTFLGSKPGPRLSRIMAALLGLGVLLVLGSSSCLKPGPKKGNSQDKQEQCESALDAAEEMARPDKLGLTSNIDDVANRLNDWQKSCSEARKVSTQLGETGRRLLEPIMSKEELRAITQDFFDDRDVRHLRNCLVFRRIANRLKSNAADTGAGSELAQVVDAFYYVVRNVELSERRPKAVPLPVFRVLMYGRGSAEDRAWLFGALLRQMKIAAVVLSPKGTQNNKPQDAPPDFLVGVLLDGDVYLFDPRLGLPVSSPKDDGGTALPGKPATLRQFVEDPAVVARLRVGKFTYPLRPSDLKHPLVQLIGHRSVWEPRMKRLHVQPLGGRVLFDGLDDDKQKDAAGIALGDGLVTRVADLGRKYWTREDISVWPYPERIYRGFTHRTAEQRSELDRLFRPFRAPITIERDQQGRIVAGVERQLQHRARMLQLQGNYRDAIKTYVSMRIDAILPPEVRAQFRPEMQAMLVRAAEDAEFWIAVCKFEEIAPPIARSAFGNIQSDLAASLESAKGSLDAYLGKHPTGAWADQARYLFTLCHLAQGNGPAARSKLREIAENHPQQHGFQLLLRRWNDYGDLSHKTPAKKKKP